MGIKKQLHKTVLTKSWLGKKLNLLLEIETKKEEDVFVISLVNKYFEDEKDFGENLE